jgi:hypothetical protein
MRSTVASTAELRSSAETKPSHSSSSTWATSNRLWPNGAASLSGYVIRTLPRLTPARVSRILAVGLKNKVYSLAALRACQILGGPGEVARRTGVSCLLIQAILKDAFVPPPSVFLKIVDIVMSADAPDARREP